jgi:hypothetical protein
VEVLVYGSLSKAMKYILGLSNFIQDGNLTIPSLVITGTIRLPSTVAEVDVTAALNPNPRFQTQSS